VFKDFILSLKKIITVFLKDSLHGFIVVAALLFVSLMLHYFL